MSKLIAVVKPQARVGGSGTIVSWEGGHCIAI